LDMQYWSKRVVIGCLATWGVMVTIYTVLGTVEHEVLPPPYNGLIMVTLSTGTLASLAVWLAARILARLDADGEQRRAMAEAIEVRDGRLYFEIARMRGEVAQLRELVEQTVDLTRVRAVGDYDTGYADGLARQPMREAKVLPMGSRGNGS